MAHRSSISANRPRPLGAYYFLSKDQATEVIKTMGVLLVGVAGADLAPSLTDEDIPSDIRQLIQSFSSRPIFIKNAHRIIQGIRHDALEPEE